jgi:hypothetical protein
MKFGLLAAFFISALIITACSALRLEPAYFAWAVESVLQTDETGVVTDERYSLSFNTAGVFYEEFKDSATCINSEIRLLRDNNGYYYLTGEKFKNVYVFVIDDGSFKLSSQIPVSESGLVNPALNQRSPFIELLDGENSLYLTNKGIYEDKK